MKQVKPRIKPAKKSDEKISQEKKTEWRYGNIFSEMRELERKAMDTENFVLQNKVRILKTELSHLEKINVKYIIILIISLTINLLLLIEKL